MIIRSQDLSNRGASVGHLLPISMTRRTVCLCVHMHIRIYISCVIICVYVLEFEFMLISNSKVTGYVPFYFSLYISQLSSDGEESDSLFDLLFTQSFWMCLVSHHHLPCEVPFPQHPSASACVPFSSHWGSGTGLWASIRWKSLLFSLLDVYCSVMEFGFSSISIGHIYKFTHWSLSGC